MPITIIALQKNNLSISISSGIFVPNLLVRLCWAFFRTLVSLGRFWASFFADKINRIDYVPVMNGWFSVHINSFALRSCTKVFLTRTERKPNDNVSFWQAYWRERITRCFIPSFDVSVGCCYQTIIRSHPLCHRPYSFIKRERREIIIQNVQLFRLKME